MNQQDFRRLVASGSHGNNDSKSRAGQRSFGGKRNLTDEDLQQIKRLSAKKPKKASTKRNTSSHDDPEELSSKPKKDVKPKYRDRAAERRMGKQSDMIDAEEFAHLDADKTKFLGGDLAHTHLVKGLDFALLAQLKREKEKLLEATKQATKVSAAVASTSALQLQPHGQERSDPTKVEFKSTMARLVYQHACVGSNPTTTSSSTTTNNNSTTIQKTKPVESFLPGRMQYRFNVNSTSFDSVPLVVHFAKEDCPDQETLVSGRLDQLVIDQITDAWTGVGENGKKRRRKRKLPSSSAPQDLPPQPSTASFTTTQQHQQDQPQQQSVEDKEEDIFADAGEYVPVYLRPEEEEQEAKKKQRKQQLEASRQQSGGIFGDLSAALTEKERQEQAEEEHNEANAWKDTLRDAMLQRARAEHIKKRQEEATAKAKLSAEAEYSDSYQTMNAAAYYDSDGEDDDIGKKTTTGKKKKKRNRKNKSDQDTQNVEE